MHIARKTIGVLIAGRQSQVVLKGQLVEYNECLRCVKCMDSFECTGFGNYEMVYIWVSV